jgi:hypothetical protein
VSVTLLAALLAQAVSVTLLRHRLGRHWLRHPVTLVVLAGVVYQGLAPVLLTIPSVAAWNTFRLGIQPGYADDAALLTSAGMLAFTLGFLVTRPERSILATDPAGIRDAAAALGWKWLVVACVPLAALTYEGRGYNDSHGTGVASSVGTDLAATFFLITVALASAGFLLSRGTRWFLPVLVIQSAVLAAAGERTPVLTDAIALILVLTFAGRRPRTRQIWGAGVIALVAIIAITGLRVQQGRSVFYTNSGLSARLSALGDGLTSFAGPPVAGPATPGLLAQAATRLDGVDFTAGILQSVHLGQPRLPASYAAQSLLIVVPSSLWSSKLSRGTLNPALLETGNFGLQPVNFLPTMSGLYAGYLSPPWLLAFLAFLGLACGRAERRLFRCCTPARLVFLAGAVMAALEFESGLPGMLVQLRSAAVIAVAVKVTEVLRRRHASPARAPAAPRREYGLRPTGTS